MTQQSQTQSEALEPRNCPFCTAALSHCEDREGEFWMHPGVVTDDDCFMSGQGIFPRQLSAWNRRTPAAAPVGLRELAGDIVATGDHAKRHLEIRDRLNRAIYAVLHGYRMGNMVDDEGYGYPLLDLMSNPAPADIGTGEMEMVCLADDIVAAVRALTPPAQEVETRKDERERCAALLEAQSERDVEASHYCRSGNAGESLRRQARRRKEDARAIRSQGDVSC